MRDLIACIACLSSTSKLFSLDIGYLRRDYNLVSGLKTFKGNGMPEHLCFECRSYVQKFKHFRVKCQRSGFTLQEILSRHQQVQRIHLEQLNRSTICVKTSLDYFKKSCISYEAVIEDDGVQKDKTKMEKIKTLTSKVQLPIFTFSTLDLPKFTEEIPINSSLMDQKNYNSEKLEENDEFNFDFEPIGYISDENNHSDYLDESLSFDDVLAKDINKKKKKQKDYCTPVTISFEEACAAYEIQHMNKIGEYKCSKCHEKFNSEVFLKNHERVHDKHISGMYNCKVCDRHYKTELLLNMHMEERHNYKYLCQICSEVSFTRRTAREHYITHHEVKKATKVLPKKKLSSNSKKKKSYKNEEDFPKCLVVSQSDQYKMILDRKTSRNYLESQFRCELCYKGFRMAATLESHMKRHDPNIWGKFQCDMCKVYEKTPRRMYKHMRDKHLFRYQCQMCDYSCASGSQAAAHYKHHKNVTYECPHCDRVFNKPTSQMTHIRLKHPSTQLCSLCGHSFVSESGLTCHLHKAHSQQEREISAASVKDLQSALYCSECDVQLLNEAAFRTHLLTSNKHCSQNMGMSRKRPPRRGRGTSEAEAGAETRKRKRLARTEVLNNGVATTTNCEICGLLLKNDVQASKHYLNSHPGVEFLKRYMCDVCGHATKQYANLVVHMRRHTQERPYACPHCDRRFSMPSNRDRHIVVHTGEKRYECHQCHRRFSQSSAVKLHIQTVHMKIPYAPWDKKNRKRRKEMETQVPFTEPKLIAESAGEYLNTYVSFQE